MAHSNYYLDLCVDTFIVHDGAVLLRLHEKYHYWGAPGGHIDPGEDVNEAALREVWEETGLEVELIGPAGWRRFETDTDRDLVPPIFVNRHSINDVHEHSSFIFAARSRVRAVAPQTEADQGAEFLWVTQKELDMLLERDARVSEATHRYASAALALVS